jgi:hypothetical protein
MPGRSPLAVRRSWLWAEPGLPSRPLPGQRHHEGIAQTFELRSQLQGVLSTFGSEAIRSDAAPLQAQLEQGGGPEVCGAAAQGMSSIPESRGVGIERRGFELFDQLLGVRDEVPDQAAEEIVGVVQLMQTVQVGEIEGGARLGVGSGGVHGLRRRPRARS